MRARRTLPMSNQLAEWRCAAMARYHAPAPTPSAGAIVLDTLGMVAREGAQRMLQWAVEDEVRSFLGRDRYAPGGRDTGYRNGHGRAREIGIGTWSVEVHPPRISDLPPGAEPLPRASCPGAATSPRTPSGCSPGCTSRACARATSSPPSAGSSANGPLCRARRSCGSRPTGRPTIAPSATGRSRAPSPTCGPTASTSVPAWNPRTRACS